jgi:predicted aldo/keto reductase-like oxidoreductase
MVDFTEIKVHGNKVKKIAKKNKDLCRQTTESPTSKLDRFIMERYQVSLR